MCYSTFLKAYTEEILTSEHRQHLSAEELSLARQDCSRFWHNHRRDILYRAGSVTSPAAENDAQEAGKTLWYARHGVEEFWSGRWGRTQAENLTRAAVRLGPPPQELDTTISALKPQELDTLLDNIPGMTLERLVMRLEQVEALAAELRGKLKDLQKRQDRSILETRHQ